MVSKVQQALAFPPLNEDTGWDKYELHLDADPRQVRTRICLLDFGRRPAMFYETRDQANTQHAVTYARVQPKL